MDEENVVHVHSGVLVRHKQEGNHDLWKLDGTRGNHVKWNKQDSEINTMSFSYVESRWGEERERDRNKGDH